MKTTHLLIVLNVLVYAAMLGIAGVGEAGGFSTGTLIQFGSLYSPLVRDGQVWRVLTAVFMHLNPLHLAMNMVALYQAGTVLEPHYGRVRFLILYLLAGLGGSAASLAFNWVAPVSSAGASGAISGLIGAGIVAGHLLGGPAGMKFRDAMLRWAIAVMVFGFIAHADNAAHGGGLVVGALVAWLYDRGGARAQAKRAPATTGLGVDSVLLIALVGACFALAGRARESSLLTEEVLNSGVELAKQGKDAEAIEKYRRALRMDPREVIAHYDLSLALARQNDLAGALAEARAALAIDPGYYRAYFVLSQILEQQGQDREAAEATKKYLELKGKDPTPPATPDGGAD